MSTHSKTRIDHLSHSQVNEFTRCPRKYHLHRRLGLEPEFCPSGLLFGSAMHNALAVFHQLRLEGREAGIELLMKQFRSTWENEDLPVRLKDDQSAESMRSLARRMLHAYLEDRPEDGQVIAVEESFRLQFDENIPSLVGRMDLLEQSDDGELMLTDFKTASSRREPGPDQLVLYRQAVSELGYCQDAEVRTRYVVLTKTKEPDVISFEMETGPDEADRLRSLYRSAWEAIRSGCKFPRPGWWCRGCQWQSRCDQWED